MEQSIDMEIVRTWGGWSAMPAHGDSPQFNLLATGLMGMNGENGGEAGDRGGGTAGVSAANGERPVKQSEKQVESIQVKSGSLKPSPSVQATQ